MRRKFEGSTIAPLAVLLTVSLIGPTKAGEFTPSPQGATHPPAAPCGDAERGCARIRGHIPAASEFAGVETIGGRPAAFRPPPFDAAGQGADDALGQGLFLLQASHDETER
jgi:hypothetical protein